MFLRWDTICFYLFQYSLYFQRQRSKKRRKDSQKQKERKRCCHEGHYKLLWRLNYCKIWVAHIKEKKIIQIDLRKLYEYFFFHFQLASLPRVALQRECQISLKRRKFYWKKCILEFRKCGIKNCEWSKIPEKCVIKEYEWWLWFRKCIIKECEFWAKFTFFNSAFFCSADFSGVFVLDFK